MPNLLQNMNKQKSPNYTPDPNFKPTITVIHGTRGGYEGAVHWLCTPPHARPDGTYSSAHFVIGKKYGQVTQLVDTKHQAWHAGRVSSPSWTARQLMKRRLGVPKIVPVPDTMYVNPNSYTIGIELELLSGETSKDLTEWQYDCAAALIKEFKLPTTLLMHKQITIDKSDFQDAKGGYDTTPITEIAKRLTKSN